MQGRIVAWFTEFVVRFDFYSIIRPLLSNFGTNFNNSSLSLLAISAWIALLSLLVIDLTFLSACN